MKIYSPSQTMSFFSCPAEWRLDQAGWRSKMYGRKELASILGDAFHLAHAEYYRNGAVPPIEGIREAYALQARLKAENELKALDTAGFECWPNDLDLRNALPLKAQTLVYRWLGDNKVPKEWQIVAVEHMLRDFGWCKIDLLVRPYPMDRLAVVDAKVKLRLEKKEINKELEKYAYSWQFMHYAWAAAQHYEEPVTDYFVMLVVLEPGFHIQLEHYTVNPELMLLWEQSAKAAWAVMAAMEGDGDDLMTLLHDHEEKPLYPWHGWDFFTRYGRREYTDAFLRHRLHDHLMKESYINTKEVTVEKGT